MADSKREFKISFRTLLVDAARALAWPDPVYSHADLEMNRANLILARGPGPTAGFFRGDKGKTLAESEENAAEQAIDYLVQKKQIIVDDVNLERKEMYKSCCKFYQKKRKALESVECQAPNVSVELVTRKNVSVAVPTCLPKMISVDLWDIWVQLVVAYQVTVDEMAFIRQPDGNYVCCFTLTWPCNSPREKYFIGDACENVDKARQSLAKKAIIYLQGLYGFTVKDASFNRMRYFKIQCGFKRRSYIWAKEKHICVAADLESVPLFCSAQYSTPEGPAYAIQSGLSLPPPPKKTRKVWSAELPYSAAATAGEPVHTEDAV